jgi:putative colanic acid biosynthesis acetyltransferase WcaF
MNSTMNNVKQEMDLASFDGSTLVRGRGKSIEALWWLFRVAFVQTSFPWPSGFRKSILQLFGASIGKGFYCRPGLAVHFPWKLTIGDNVWIGERCTLHNLEKIEIGSNTAIAHEVFITTGSHDIYDSKFGYLNRAVAISSSCVISSRATILSGCHIQTGAVVAAGAVVTKDVPYWNVVAGVPAKTIGIRELRG